MNEPMKELAKKLLAENAAGEAAALASWRAQLTDAATRIQPSLSRFRLGTAELLTYSVSHRVLRIGLTSADGCNRLVLIQTVLESMNAPTWWRLDQPTITVTENAAGTPVIQFTDCLNDIRTISGNMDLVATDHVLAQASFPIRSADNVPPANLSQLTSCLHQFRHGQAELSKYGESSRVLLVKVASNDTHGRLHIELHGVEHIQAIPSWKVVDACVIPSGNNRLTFEDRTNNIHVTCTSAAAWIEPFR